MSIRDVATLAGVNHGQVHHYFNGKEGLIKAAMRSLAQEHLEHATERAHGAAMPPALTLSHDRQYQRAVIRLVLDGRVDLATMEIDDGVSVPRNILAEMTRSAGLKKPSIEAKAVLAGIIALEQGWGALEDYIFKMVDASPSEMKKIRKLIIKVFQELPRTMGLDIPDEDAYGAREKIVKKKNNNA
jgi:AcrR family transcriptional regulator